MKFVKEDRELIYKFKVQDFTTILLGRKGIGLNNCIVFYIERGDGTRYEYTLDRVEWYRAYKMSPLWRGFDTKYMSFGKIVRKPLPNIFSGKVNKEKAND